MSQQLKPLTVQKVQAILRLAGLPRSRYERVGRRSERIPGYEVQGAGEGAVLVEYRESFGCLSVHRAAREERGKAALANYRAALEVAGLTVVERDGGLEVTRKTRKEQD